MSFAKSSIVFLLCLNDILCSAVTRTLANTQTTTDHHGQFIMTSKADLTSISRAPKQSLLIPKNYNIMNYDISTIQKKQKQLILPKHVDFKKSHNFSSHGSGWDLKSMSIMQKHNSTRTSFSLVKSSRFYNSRKFAILFKLLNKCSKAYQFDKSKQGYELPSPHVCRFYEKIKTYYTTHSTNSKNTARVDNAEKKSLSALIKSSKRTRRNAGSNIFPNSKDAVLKNSRENGLPKVSVMPGYYSHKGGRILQVLPNKIRGVNLPNISAHCVIETHLDDIFSKITQLWAKKSKVYIAMAKDYTLYTTNNKSDPNTKFTQDYEPHLYDAFKSIPHQSYLAIRINGNPVNKKIESARDERARFLLIENLEEKPYNLKIESLQDDQNQLDKKSRNKVKKRRRKPVSKADAAVPTTVKKQEITTSPNKTQSLRKCNLKYKQCKSRKRGKRRKKCRSKLKKCINKRKRKSSRKENKRTRERQRRSGTSTGSYPQKISNHYNLKQKSLLHKRVSLKTKSSS